jgi:hypothetical protein
LVRVYSTKFEEVFPGRERDTDMPSLGIDFCKVVGFDPIGPRADNLHAPGAMHQRSLRVTCARLRSSQTVTNLHRAGRLVVHIQKRCVNERVHLEQALPPRCHHLFRRPHFLLCEDLNIGPLQVRRVKMFPAPTGRSAHGSPNTRAAAHTRERWCPSLRSNISLAKEFQRTGVYGVLRVVRQRRRVSTLSSAQLDPMHRLQRRQGKCCPCAGHQDGGGGEPPIPPHSPEVAGSIEIKMAGNWCSVGIVRTQTLRPFKLRVSCKQQKPGPLAPHARSESLASTQSRCGGGVAACPRWPGACSGLPTLSGSSPVPACGRRGRLEGAGRQGWKVRVEQGG